MGPQSGAMGPQSGVWGLAQWSQVSAPWLNMSPGWRGRRSVRVARTQPAQCAWLAKPATGSGLQDNWLRPAVRL